ncbi:hypothetical protein ANCCAN_10613 [Ancylostoma caninum]|uniref:Uncharacterized protein n=1 Tax=Ancylostoma caninum TaxID=29170 RepID=A0A368GGD0_ANCCA|nr:hypothetical protein ANCCAN_10613 [Ancylostoma caninum]
MLGSIVLIIANMITTTLFLTFKIACCQKKGGHNRAHSGSGAAIQSPAHNQEPSGPPMKSTASEERRRERRSAHAQEVKEKTAIGKRSEGSKNEQKSSAQKTNLKKSETLDGGPNDIAAAEEMGKALSLWDFSTRHLC